MNTGDDATRWIAENWDEATATLTGAQAEHMIRVLRAQPGEEADVVAGGRVFHSVVASITDGGPGGDAGGEVQPDR